MLALLSLAAISVLMVQLARSPSDRVEVGVELVNVLVSPDGDLEVLVLLDNPQTHPVSDISCDLSLFDPEGDAISGVRTSGLKTDKTLAAQSKGATTFYLGGITETVATMEGSCSAAATG